MLALGGCASDTPGVAQPATTQGRTEATPLPLTIPTPKGKAVLTFTGKIGASNLGGALVLDRTAIDGLGKIDLEVLDPFKKLRTGYKGVWLADLLRTAEVDGSARNLQMTALDDYVVNISTADVRAGGIFLAVANADGSVIPVADGGPTRIVFTDGTPSGNNTEQWIWSLATIEVQ